MIDFVNICGIIDHHGLNFLFKSLYQNLKSQIGHDVECDKGMDFLNLIISHSERGGYIAITLSVR